MTSWGFIENLELKIENSSVSSILKVMTILGIDPGYERVGTAIVAKEQGQKETVLYSDCFKTSPNISFEERLLFIGNEIQRLIDTYKPTALSIENLFLSNNQKTAMRVSEVRGAIIYIAMINNLNIKEFTPLQIKSAVGGHGKSDKNSMIKMIPILVKINKKIKHDDEYDAIACGLTYFAYSR
jgi:crossover junction endodeoxyribonuclease RuvC